MQAAHSRIAAIRLDRTAHRPYFRLKANNGLTSSSLLPPCWTWPGFCPAFFLAKRPYGRAGTGLSYQTCPYFPPPSVKPERHLTAQQDRQQDRQPRRHPQGGAKGNAPSDRPSRRVRGASVFPPFRSGSGRLRRTGRHSAAAKRNDPLRLGEWSRCLPGFSKTQAKNAPC